VAESPFWAQTKLYKQILQKTATPVYYATHCSQVCVTDLTDGLISMAISFSQFQNWAVLKLPDFKTSAAEWTLYYYH
jgi:hypothetical protein